MIKRNFLLLIALFVFPSRFLFAQDTSVGDSSVVTYIHQELKDMYGKNDTTFYLLTKRQLHKITTNGTNVSIEKTDNTISRIVIISFTKSGEFAEEYLFKNGKLIFVYQTFTYFQEVPSKTKAVNFKGQRYWETRFYFTDERLKYQKTTGEKEMEHIYFEKDLLEVKNKLLRLD